MPTLNDLPLPLTRGVTGDAVLDLQFRLAEVDLPCSDSPGIFGTSTESALREFQRRRLIESTGICDQRTWLALVEAGYQLGDRLLYQRDPMLRGDDVGDLQRRLSILGFDPGRIDGIFGRDTAEALKDFQRNAGLPIDGMCGQRTLADLIRVQTPEGAVDLVSPLRERLSMRETGNRTLAEREFAVGEPGGFAPGVVAICRNLRLAGARALEFHDPSPSRQAVAANTAGADCFVSIRIAPERTSCTTAFYSGFHYESVTSRQLAEIIQQRLPATLGLENGGTCGMALPILRETRMPAIEIQLGSPTLVVQQTVALARVVVASLGAWVELNFS
ncbi:MAG TPA: peptidoglycan-binding protein [Acidimicrobiales bacterium]|nr:peptidoglycan-binding protein [Acidimicrobiales bacterium]